MICPDFGATQQGRLEGTGAIQQRRLKALVQVAPAPANLGGADATRLKSVREGTAGLKVHVYHGKGRSVSLRSLKRYDVVVTTYTTMALEAPLHVGPRKGVSALKPIDLCDDTSDDDDSSNDGDPNLVEVPGGLPKGTPTLLGF
jgi:hypothetical protein